MFAQCILADETPAPPLECPYCGTWTVTEASPAGSIGERIEFANDRVSLPTCGDFNVSVKTQLNSNDGERRTYRSTLELKPIQPDSLCSIAPDQTLRMEAVVSVGYRVDGGRGEFTVYGNSATTPLLSITAWNYDRDNPCDSGSGYGSAACLQVATARLIKTLSYEAYGVGAGGRLNPARFAAATMDFCSKREVGNGGGSWPYVWALDCQAERLQAKLKELRAWSACRTGANPSSCKPPNENFDRLPRKEL